jgi:hypothetical protein
MSNSAVAAWRRAAPIEKLLGDLRVGDVAGGQFVAGDQPVSGSTPTHGPCSRRDKSGPSCAHGGSPDRRSRSPDRGRCEHRCATGPHGRPAPRLGRPPTPTGPEHRSVLGIDRRVPRPPRPARWRHRPARRPLVRYRPGCPSHKAAGASDVVLADRHRLKGRDEAADPADLGGQHVDGVLAGHASSSTVESIALRVLPLIAPEARISSRTASKIR